MKNTLALQSSADYVAAVGSVADARDAIEFGRAKGAELRCLGEGSNVILMPRVSGLICHVTQAEVCVVDSDAESVTIAVGAGKIGMSWCKRPSPRIGSGLKILR